MQQTGATETTNANTVVERDPAEPITGACVFCGPYVKECSHVCGACGQDVEMEGDGPVYADDAPTEHPVDGFYCSSCGTYTHNGCGSDGSCNPCIAWWKNQPVAA